MLIAVLLLPGIVVGMLIEYWAHRMEHSCMFRPVDHTLHHMANTSRGWLWEFWADFKYAVIPLVLAAIVLSYIHADVAIGLCGGFLLHMLFSAYVHELNHTNESLVFWMRPIHFFHHNNRNWKKNFGVTNTLMDRIFGTYLDDPTWTRKPMKIRDLVSVRWY